MGDVRFNSSNWSIRQVRHVLFGKFLLIGSENYVKGYLKFYYQFLKIHSAKLREKSTLTHRLSCDLGSTKQV